MTELGTRALALQDEQAFVDCCRRCCRRKVLLSEEGDGIVVVLCHPRRRQHPWLLLLRSRKSLVVVGWSIATIMVLGSCSSSSSPAEGGIGATTSAGVSPAVTLSFCLVQPLEEIDVLLCCVDLS